MACRGEHQWQERMRNRLDLKGPNGRDEPPIFENTVYYICGRIASISDSFNMGHAHNVDDYHFIIEADTIRLSDLGFTLSDVTDKISCRCCPRLGHTLYCNHTFSLPETFVIPPSSSTQLSLFHQIAMYKTEHDFSIDVTTTIMDHDRLASHLCLLPASHSAVQYKPSGKYEKILPCLAYLFCG
jgi:hypothetical protein